MRVGESPPSPLQGHFQPEQHVVGASGGIEGAVGRSSNAVAFGQADDQLIAVESVDSSSEHLVELGVKSISEGALDGSDADGPESRRSPFLGAIRATFRVPTWIRLFSANLARTEVGTQKLKPYIVSASRGCPGRFPPTTRGARRSSPRWGPGRATGLPATGSTLIDLDAGLWSRSTVRAGRAEIQRGAWPHRLQCAEHDQVRNHRVRKTLLPGMLFGFLVGLQTEDQAIVLKLMRDSAQHAIVAGDQINTPWALGRIDPIGRRPFLTRYRIDDCHLTTGDSEDAVPGKSCFDQPRPEILSLSLIEREPPGAGEHLMKRTLKLGIRRLPAVVTRGKGKWVPSRIGSSNRSMSAPSPRFVGTR